MAEAERPQHAEWVAAISRLELNLSKRQALLDEARETKRHILQEIEVLQTYLRQLDELLGETPTHPPVKRKPGRPPKTPAPDENATATRLLRMVNVLKTGPRTLDALTEALWNQNLFPGQTREEAKTLVEGILRTTKGQALITTGDDGHVRLLQPGSV